MVGSLAVEYCEYENRYSLIITRNFMCSMLQAQAPQPNPPVNQDPQEFALFLFGRFALQVQQRDPSL